MAAAPAVLPRCTVVVWVALPSPRRLPLSAGESPQDWNCVMDHLRIGLGTFWILFTVVAATLLGTDFILHEIRVALRNHRESETK